MVKKLRAFLSQVRFKILTILCGVGLFFSNPALGTLAEQRQMLSQIQTCEQFNNPITILCTNNSLMDQAQKKSRFLQNLLSRTQSGAPSDVSQQLNGSNAVATEAQVTNQQVQQVCQEAASQCRKQCNDDAMKIATDPSQQQKFEQYQQISQKCQKELQSTMQRTGMALSEIAAVLASIGQVMQALGIGQKDASLADINKPSDDPCDGQFADMLIECTGQSGPTSTRAGLNGNPLVGGVGANADGLFQTGSQGEPGGDRAGLNKAATSGASSGFSGGAGMVGGVGLGGLGGGSGSSMEPADSDINSDTQQGFMATGGGPSGGGGGGSSSGGRAVTPFKGFAQSEPSSEGLGRAMIDRKLKKLTNDTSSRAPASADGKNGPFQDNWSVINKAYKKNASSMFHQE